MNPDDSIQLQHQVQLEVHLTKLQHWHSHGRPSRVLEQRARCQASRRTRRRVRRARTAPQHHWQRDRVMRTASALAVPSNAKQSSASHIQQPLHLAELLHFSPSRGRRREEAGRRRRLRHGRAHVDARRAHLRALQDALQRARAQAAAPGARGREALEERLRRVLPRLHGIKRRDASKTLLPRPPRRRRTRAPPRPSLPRTAARCLAT